MMGVGSGLGNWNGSDYPEGLQCPSFPDKFAEPDVMNHGRLYGWNRTTIRPGPGVAGFEDGGYIRRVAVSEPASTFAMTDANDWNVVESQANYNVIWDTTRELNGLEGGHWGATMYRHNEGANFLHFDNHVAYFNKQEAFPQDTEERHKQWYVYTDWWWE